MTKIDQVFDEIVYHAQMVERYERRKAMSPQEQEQLTTSYQMLAHLRKRVKLLAGDGYTSYDPFNDSNTTY